MAKRRLTQRQVQRIREKQEARRQRAKTQLTEEASEGTEQTGLVVSRHGKSIIVEDNRSHLYKCTPRQNIGSPVVGDNVVFQASNENEGVLLAICNRHTLLSRPMQDGSEKPVAANINRIFIVSAIRPEPSMHLIDRYLVVSECLQLDPVIVINKIDLLEGEQDLSLEQALAVYEALGYQVIYSSTRLETGLDDIRQSLIDHTSIMVGQSGVGKSSLIKCLLPDIDIRIGELTEIDQGRHTTTTSSLYHLPDGGNLIDSPGVRDFAVWNLQPDDVLYGFREFRPYTGQCKFRNCTHHNEPGCAIREAAESNRIDQRRFDSYRQMIDEISSHK